MYLLLSFAFCISTPETFFFYLVLSFVGMVERLSSQCIIADRILPSVRHSFLHLYVYSRLCSKQSNVIFLLVILQRATANIYQPPLPPCASSATLISVHWFDLGQQQPSLRLLPLPICISIPTSSLLIHFSNISSKLWLLSIEGLSCHLQVLNSPSLIF